MLEGLEVSEVLKSFFLKDNVDFRLDAEYFSKRNIELNCVLDKTGFERIEKTAFVTDGIHTSIDYSEDSDVKLVSATSPRENYFDFSRNVYISKESHLQNPRTALKAGDVIISTVGTIGNCAVTTASDLPANSDRDVSIIRITNKQFLPNYVSTFLISKYGRFQTLRESTGNVQLHLFIYKIKTLKIADLPMCFQTQVDEKVRLANNKREQSQSLYREAEALLLETIGLHDFHPTRENKNIKTFKESFLATGRLDAEYYQPKYEEVENIIKRFPCETIEDICSAINYGTVPTSLYTEDGTGTPYIKGMNLKNLRITENLDRITNTDALSDKFYTEIDDIIISQMGTVGDVGIITEKEKDYLFASFTIRIRIKNKKQFNPYYVGLYIQNVAKEWYLHRNIAQASVRQNTDLPTVKHMYIPLIDIPVQLRIAALIKESFALRGESGRLLNEAKELVEREIEKG